MALKSVMICSGLCFSRLHRIDLSIQRVYKVIWVFLDVHLLHCWLLIMKTIKLCFQILVNSASWSWPRREKFGSFGSLTTGWESSFVARRIFMRGCVLNCFGPWRFSWAQYNRALLSGNSSDFRSTRCTVLNWLDTLCLHQTLLFHHLYPLQIDRWNFSQTCFVLPHKVWLFLDDDFLDKCGSLD